MISASDAYRRLMRANPDFKIETGVDFNKDYYVFVGGYDTYAVNKKTGKVVSFSIPFHLKEYFEAVEKRPLDVGMLTTPRPASKEKERLTFKSKWG